MGMFDQMKMASDMLKDMSPEEREKLLEQAKNSRGMLEETVQKLLEEEIQKRGLVTKDEVTRMIEEGK
ncbi:hypothetical protein CL635_03315 [bacterium]|nr:hypothetical protein [bacterium]|tara:strand:- start:1047 stop:1250 length:204 start_codon:yes stop_codon:yes gene_type:complete